MKTFKSYTFTRIFAALFFCLGFCCSCIDEFKADLPESDQQYLVVEGSICGQSDCEFYLSRSLSLNPSAEEIIGRNITDARLTVCGSDNSRLPATQSKAGCYLVTLGELNRDLEYWVEIEWEGRTYQSTPTQPLKTPGIADLHFEQPREDKQVDILITPMAENKGEIQYMQWDYQENWEIVTPYQSIWEYDFATGKIALAKVLLNRGWCKDLNHQSIISDNINFTNHEIRNLRLISIDNMDNRFNRRYCVTVRQRAISHEQYEYEKLAQRQSDDMGGLFTPQPSELPSNIKCSDSQYKTIGYIGVTLNAVQQRLFITSTDVGYRLNRIPKILKDEEAAEIGSVEDILARGYRILDYVEQINQKQWIERWGIDATAWGASLEMPDFWPIN